MSQKIESLILDQFAAMSASVGHCIDEWWIIHKLRPALNPKEQDEIDATIQDLIARKIITADNKSGLLVMALAQGGFDLIYPNDPDAARLKIRKSILKRFANTQSRVGHYIDERWIIHTLVQSLNPREKLEVNSAIDALVADGLITTDNRMSMTVLVLTQVGFDAIY